MIGSLSKTLTGMLAATLVDDGLLDWNTAVMDLLPNFVVSDVALAPPADAAAAYLGPYTDDVRVPQHQDDLIISSVYGDLQFRANPDETRVFVGVDAVSTGMLAEFTLTTVGAMRLRLAYSDPLGEVIVERRQPNPDPPAECSARP
jgi:hypothetical protein